MLPRKENTFADAKWNKFCFYLSKTNIDEPRQYLNYLNISNSETFATKIAYREN